MCPPEKIMKRRAAASRAGGERAAGGRNADWLTSFPTRNPNPVVELDRSGRVLYANPASAADRRALRLADAVIPEPFDVERLLN